ncbi:MAG: hydroxyacid dehydrogenase [Ignavibacteriales bacterium]
MHKILVVQRIHPGGMAILEAGGQVVIPRDPSDEAVISEGRDAEALVVRLTKVRKSLIDALPALRVIGRNGVGVDEVDVEAASARGIMVINTPGTNSNSVAEYVISAFMSLYKRLPALDDHTRRGDWKARDQIKGFEVEGRTIGIVGMGRIGSLLARKCRLGLGMNVVAYDPLVSPDAIREAGATPCEDLDSILAQSDVVSLHLPLTPETRGLFDSGRLRRMKREAVLVNASRGGIVDERGLAEALRDGAIAGAAVDVFDNEPPARDNPLWGAPNLLVTPHIGGMTEDAARRTAETMAADVIRALNGENPVNLYNREALKQKAL